MIIIKKYKLLGIALICALISMIISFTGLLDKAELSLSDDFYQHGNLTDGQITVVAIDDKTLDELGPFSSWKRTNMAQVIEKLNSDLENKPAVIGIDTMFFGNTNPEDDSYLARVCKEGGNVVLAGYAKFTNRIVKNEKGDISLQENYLEEYQLPYDELKAVTTQGHANVAADKDGIIRNSVQQLRLPNEEEIDSFSYKVYEKYQEVTNQEKVKSSTSKLYIPFSGKDGAYYDGYSFLKVLNGEIPTTAFKGKIVLIGAYASGMMDSYITSIDHTKKINGVEIHANVIDLLRNQNFKRKLPRDFELLLLGMIVGLCTIFFNKRKIKVSTTFTVGLILIYLLIAFIGYQFGVMLNILEIPLFVLIVYLISIVTKYITAILEKRKVMNTFKKYVAPQVVDKLVKEGIDKIELGGKKTEIACLFVDIRGFTTMSESLEPEQVVEILNEYLNLTSTCIFKNEGTLDKFIGDATMAIFNAPVELDDYIYKAVKTARDIAKGAEELNVRLKAKTGKEVSFGIGVNCGEAVVGNIGTEARVDYTAIGDTVNTAARLESNAKAGQILISKKVHDALEGRIKDKSIGVIPLKGKTESAEVFEIENI